TSQQISPNPRYAKLVEDMQWLARRLQIFGVHVHVGVRWPQKAIPIVNALTAYLPHFLALSASSPYWIGTDTGLASARSKVFEGLPTAGLPYQLSGWNDFETEHDIYRDDAILDYPQSGERIRGRRKIQLSRTAQPNKQRVAVKAMQR